MPIARIRLEALKKVASSLWLRKKLLTDVVLGAMHHLQHSPQSTRFTNGQQSSTTTIERKAASRLVSTKGPYVPASAWCIWRHCATIIWWRGGGEIRGHHYVRSAFCHTHHGGKLIREQIECKRQRSAEEKENCCRYEILSEDESWININLMQTRRNWTKRRSKQWHKWTTRYWKNGIFNGSMELFYGVLEPGYHLFDALGCALDEWNHHTLSLDLPWPNTRVCNASMLGGLFSIDSRSPIGFVALNNVFRSSVIRY